MKGFIQYEEGVSILRMELNSREPVYIQVIRYFKERIASGVLEPGTEIPSRRELANTLKINPNTVQRAYKEMEELGLIYTEGNLPSKVTTNEKIIQEAKDALLQDAVISFVSTIETLQIPLKDVIPMLETHYEGGEKDD